MAKLPKVPKPDMARVANLSETVPLTRHIPSAITLAALCSGATAIPFAMYGNWKGAVAAIVLIDPAPMTTASTSPRSPASRAASSMPALTIERPARSMPVSECARLPTRPLPRFAQWSKRRSLNGWRKASLPMRPSRSGS